MRKMLHSAGVGTPTGCSLLHIDENNYFDCIADMATLKSPHVLLRHNETAVGFGKSLCSNGAPSTKIYGHELREHARNGADLVSFYGVQSYHQ